MRDHQTKNRALVEYLLLPSIFLTVALLGGFRVNAAAVGGSGGFSFIAPPLVSLVLRVMLLLLFVRGRLVEWRRCFSDAEPALTNLSRALLVITLFFASAQVFNSVLPETGLLRWMFSFFFLWTLWNNLFSEFDARRLLRSLAVLFGTAFVLKHMLLASLFAPAGSWLRRFAATLLEGATLGTLDAPQFAPATGYISFFTVALYIIGLILLAAAPFGTDETSARRDLEGRADLILEAIRQLPTDEQRRLQAALQNERARLHGETQEVLAEAE